MTEAVSSKETRWTKASGAPGSDTNSRACTEQQAEQAWTCKGMVTHMADTSTAMCVQDITSHVSLAAVKFAHHKRYGSHKTA